MAYVLSVTAQIKILQEEIHVRVCGGAFQVIHIRCDVFLLAALLNGSKEGSMCGLL